MERIIWVIVVVLLILWLFGLLGDLPFFGGNFVHVLLVIALIVILFNVIGRKRGLWQRWF